MQAPPHLFQYQGSKRLLARKILTYMPGRFNKLIEPFSGSAAVSIAAAYAGRTDNFLINDINRPLISMISEAINYPDRLIEDYKYIWKEQFSCTDGHIQHYYNIRDKFNSGDTAPANFLYLLARCVKASVRYGKNGNFNQSPDKRRHGTNPEKMAKNILFMSRLLKGKTECRFSDYQEIFSMAKYGDIVYMDLPYQGVSDGKDHRYFSVISYEDFCRSLKTLQQKNIDFLVSYDGTCGSKTYGRDLPEDLDCVKINICAGISSQSTLLGKNDSTVESLYVSRSLISKISPCWH